MIVNWYEKLELSQRATPTDIEASYHRLYALHFPGDSKDLPTIIYWNYIQMAYDILRDADKRAKHDRELNGESVQEAKPAPAPAPVVSERGSAPAYRPAPVQASAPVQQAAPVQQTAPVQQAAPVKAKTEPNRKREFGDFARPVVDWVAMSWFNRDYSRFGENIKTPNPGLKKGFFGSVAFAVTVLLLGIYVDKFPIGGLKFPLGGLFILIVLGTWVAYAKDEYRKKVYLGGMGVFTAFIIASLMTTKAEGASVVLAVVLGVISVLAGLVGLPAANNFRRWYEIVFSRRISKQGIIVPVKEIKNTRVWGIPGQLDDAVEKFGEQNVALGAAGEKFTAEMMEQLLKIPGTRIFHGLKFPGSDVADVDHAIVNGDKIVFIDSKMWAGGDYRWNRAGLIIRENSGDITRIDTNFHYAVESYAKMIPEAQIRGRILIHSAYGKAISVDNTEAMRSRNGKTPETELAQAQTLFEEIGQWFTEGKPGYINKSIMRMLYKNMKVESTY